MMITRVCTIKQLITALTILITLVAGACGAPPPATQAREPIPSPAPQPNSSPTPSSGPNLVLEPPQIEGARATINGRATSEAGKISKILWVWGDGKVERSWFPAIHTYESGGVFTVLAIAYDSNGGSTAKSSTLVIDPESVPAPRPAEPPEPVPSPEPVYTLEAIADPLDGGSVTLNPDQSGYDSGTEVALTATATSGYRFASWSGDISGTSPTATITMDANKNIVAHFTYTGKTQNTLTTSVDPPGGGSVSPSEGSFDPDSKVILTAYPASGQYFKYWSENRCVLSTSATTYFAMDKDRSITAHFSQSTNRQLYITVEPPGSGSVIAKSDDGDVLTNPGESTWSNSTNLTLVAMPSSGYRYLKWSGHALGTGPEITITMDSDKRITIHFVSDNG